MKDLQARYEREGIFYKLVNSLIGILETDLVTEKDIDAALVLAKEKFLIKRAIEKAKADGYD